MTCPRGRFIACVSIVLVQVAGCGSDSGVTGGSGRTTAAGGVMGNGTSGALSDAGRNSGIDASGAAGSPSGGAVSAGGAAGADSEGSTSGSDAAGSGGVDASGFGGADWSGAAGAGFTPPKLPCDIYGAAGTACVAAHSTTRALSAYYDGKLYQVQRSSDKATRDIGTMSSGGYADAAAQDVFCDNTTCIITIIYDQTSNANHLTISPGGGAAKKADVGAKASALPVLVGGHKVYGVYVSPGTGYRNLSALGTARNGQAEGMYMVTSGKTVNDGCCFDYGNTEQPTANDTGAGHMDAVYIGNRCAHPPCSGAGPWVAADLENGLFQGNGSNIKDMSVTFELVSAMLKNNGQTTFSLKTGNAQAGRLTTQYNGTLPKGYIPMKQEGGIVMGVGGDNSNLSTGDFYEGVMTYGYPTDAADDAVQANIVQVGYAVPK